MTPLLGTKGACAAAGRARATHYRRRQLPVPKPPSDPKRGLLPHVWVGSCLS